MVQCLKSTFDLAFDLRVALWISIPELAVGAAEGVAAGGAEVVQG